MRKHVVFVTLLIGIIALFAETAWAQGRASGMSAFGTSGQGGFGSSGFGSSFGTSGFGSSFGSSGFGSSFGSGGFGSGFGGGFGSSLSGRGGFGSTSGQTGNQAFVGRDAGDMQTAFTQFSRSSSQFFSNMNRQMARTNRRQRAAVTTRNPPQPIRTEVQVAFAAPQPTAGAVAKLLQVRLAKIMSAHDMTVPLVSVQNGVAVLSGVAKSENERRVIATLVSLEPGVRSVRNEMTVAAAATDNTSSPAGS